MTTPKPALKKKTVRVVVEQFNGDLAAFPWCHDHIPAKTRGIPVEKFVRRFTDALYNAAAEQAAAGLKVLGVTAVSYGYSGAWEIGLVCERKETDEEAMKRHHEEEKQANHRASRIALLEKELEQLRAAQKL